MRFPAPLGSCAKPVALLSGASGLPAPAWSVFRCNSISNAAGRGRNSPPRTQPPLPPPTQPQLGVECGSMNHNRNQQRTNSPPSARHAPAAAGAEQLPARRARRLTAAPRNGPLNPAKLRHKSQSPPAYTPAGAFRPAPTPLPGHMRPTSLGGAAAVGNGWGTSTPRPRSSHRHEIHWRSSLVADHRSPSPHIEQRRCAFPRRWAAAPSL